MTTPSTRRLTSSVEGSPVLGPGCPSHPDLRREGLPKLSALWHLGGKYVCPDGCDHAVFVALSCKTRGLCPSCGAKYMAKTAMHLEQTVLPRVPFRQWVVSFPNPHFSPDSCCGEQGHAIFGRTRSSLLDLLQVGLRRSSLRSAKSHAPLLASRRNLVRNAG